MTQEEKELVLKDICTRLPYGVRVEISWEYSKTDVYTSSEYYEFPNIDSLLNIFWDEKCISIKPYLRPMSSMTEEEKKELEDICTMYNGGNTSTYEYFGIEIFHISRYGTDFESDYTAIDWLNKKGFDYRGLIPMGLAVAAIK